MISVQNLCKSFGRSPVLKNLNLEVCKGDLLVLIGPSGCGKSTFLRCLNGLEVLDSGKITLAHSLVERVPGSTFDVRAFDHNTHKIREKVGMVFQSFNLFPHMTLLQNIIKAPIVVKKMSREEATFTARLLLKKVGLKDLESRYPHEVSGGQQQRAAIARALALSPEVMLYDEPTSALDPELVDEVLDVMKTLDQEGMTQIVVSHEMHFAKNAADTVIFMDQGEFVEQAAPEVLFNAPKDERSRRFLRRFL